MYFKLIKLIVLLSLLVCCGFAGRVLYGRFPQLCCTRERSTSHKEMENYNSRLRCWTQIAEGDSAGIQDFADFLVCSEGAMQSMQYMEELNSPWILQEISSKLPLRSGSRWCREAHDVLRKTNRTVSFHDLVVFVKEEADLAKDPVFSPEALKRERNKMTDKNRGKRVQGANSFVSLSSRTQSSESRRKSNEVEGQNSTQAFFSHVQR